jgi:hypothetical protein
MPASGGIVENVEHLDFEVDEESSPRKARFRLLAGRKLPMPRF